MGRLIYPSLQQPVPLAVVNEANWHQGWPLPVRQRIKSQHAVALAASSGNQFDPFPLPNIVPTPDKYGAVWSSPVRTRPGLRPSQQQFLAFTPNAPFPEDVNYAKFGFPWSTPVKLQKRGLGAAQQQAAVTPTFFTDQFSIPFSAYGSNWSVPVKLEKSGLSASQQQAAVVPTFFVPVPPAPYPGRLYANAIVRDRSLESQDERERTLANADVRIRFLGYRVTKLQ